MSFPSAIVNRQNGQSPEDALYNAIQTDTPLGYTAISAITEAVQQNLDPVKHTKEKLREIGGDEAANAVLRGFRRGSGVKVDLDPDSLVGRQTARLMTDGARGLLDSMLDMRYGFANCCGVIASPDQEDVVFTIDEQIEWQHSIDC